MALIKCPECGHEISDKAKCCIYCGYPLQEETTDIKIKYCPYCGKKNEIENQFCAYCGKSFTSVGNSQKEESSQEDIDIMAYKKSIEPSENDLEKQKLAQQQQQLEQQRKEFEAQAKCPKCGSTSLVSEKQGFGVGKAVAGAALFGGVGLLAGGIGANNTMVKCLNCGYTFKLNYKE